MDEGTNTFFPGTNRRVVLGSPTKQASNGRIVIGIRMPLSGESLIGMPDWVGEAYEAVSKFLAEASPEVQQVADLTLAFANDRPSGELFAHPSVKVPGAELKNFTVVRAGEAEDPDVELTFKAFTPFTRDFWTWVGEMAGKEVYMHFPSSMVKPVAVKATDQQGELIPAEQSVANVQEFFVAPEAPTEGPGSEQFEQEVRESMGAPEPLSEAPRLVRTDQPEKANAKSDKARKAFKDYHTQEVGAGRSVN